MRREDVTTADQLLALHDPPWRHELVRGELRTMSPAGAWHGDVVLTLSILLGTHVRTHRLGKVYAADTGFVLTRAPDTVLAPDVAFVVAERVPRVRGDGFFEGPPDLAVEVRSPRDSRRALRAKAREWLAHGARCVWLADPKRRTLTVLDADGGRELREHEVLHGEPLVPGFTTPVAAIFAE